MEKEKITPKKIFSTITGNSTFLAAVVLVLLIIVASIATPYFLSAQNLKALMRDISFMAIVAAGQAVLLLIGDLDLSVGKLASLSGILGGLLMTETSLPPILSFVIGMLVGAALGCFNGVLITKLNINSMVATIGMQGVYSGVTMVITKGQAISNLPEEVTVVGQANIGFVPLCFIIAIAVLIIIVIFMTKTKTGRYLYAMGNSSVAAKIMGIKTSRIRILAFTVCGFLASTAGMFYLSRLGSAQATIGSNWPMNSIAACVIGGIALTGGIGHPVGSLLGAAIVSVISNVIVLLGVNIYWQDAVSGIVVVVAIALPSIISIVKEKARIKKIAAEA